MWYVLHVLTGQELDVARRLNPYEVETIVPIENRMIRTKGKWREAEYILLPGYVFVKVAMDDEIYHLLKGTMGVIKILSEGKSPSPLSERDVQWLYYLESCLREPNTIKYLDEHTYQIVSGFLKHQRDCIKKIDRHHRRIRIQFSLFGESRHLELSYRVLSS